MSVLALSVLAVSEVTRPVMARRDEFGPGWLGLVMTVTVALGIGAAFGIKDGLFMRDHQAQQMQQLFQYVIRFNAQPTLTHLDLACLLYTSDAADE